VNYGLDSGFLWSMLIAYNMHRAIVKNDEVQNRIF